MSKFKLPKFKLEKISEYLFDVSKLLLGSTFVSIFIPSSTGGNFNILTFTIGVILAISSLIIGLKLLPSPKI